MIELFDNLLRHLFLARITELKDEAQVRFQPPDSAWRTYVSNLTVNGEPVNALNIYLWDVRENRKLRSNERMREFDNRVVHETPAPTRIDCHYLITAWSPAQVTSAVEPMVDEHALLYQVVRALMDSEPFVPRSIYGPDSLPEGFPEIIADSELPAIVLPSEGFPNFADFWGTMDWRWKPGVYLIVTLPVVLETRMAGPMVTTRITEYRAFGRTGVVDTFVQISGRVLRGTGGELEPVGGAWVRLEDSGGVQVAVTTAEDDGRFTFSRLRKGSYTLRVRAEGHAEATRNIEVPSSTENYDLVLT